MFTLQTSFKSLLLGEGGGGQEPLVEVTVNSKDENSRLLSQLHSIILPLDFYPDPGSRFFSMPYPGSRIRDPSKTKKSGNKNLLFPFL
jgi:hypothetical protein